MKTLEKRDYYIVSTGVTPEGVDRLEVLRYATALLREYRTDDENLSVAFIWNFIDEFDDKKDGFVLVLYRESFHPSEKEIRETWESKKDVINIQIDEHFFAWQKLREYYRERDKKLRVAFEEWNRS